MTEKTAKSLRKVDPDLWHQAKVAALQSNITLSAWLNQAIKEKLERSGK